MVDFWSTTDELVGKVTLSLYKAFNRHPRIGWVRADKAISETMANELAELSKENRDLRLEVQLLQTKLIQRKPEILVLLNDQVEISAVINKPNVSEYMYVEKLSMADVPQHLMQYVTEAQLQEYNNALPDEDSILEYNTNLKKYEYIRANAIPITLTVKNNGNAKAHDIRVTLSIPEEIMIMKKSDFDQMKAPKRPELPVHPIKKAAKEFR